VSVEASGEVPGGVSGEVLPVGAGAVAAARP